MDVIVSVDILIAKPELLTLVEFWIWNWSLDKGSEESLKYHKINGRGIPNASQVKEAISDWLTVNDTGCTETEGGSRERERETKTETKTGRDSQWLG